jgi:hypothetical protein
VGHQPADSGFVKEVGAVFEQAEQTTGRFFQGQVEVELGRAGIEGK